MQGMRGVGGSWQPPAALGWGRLIPQLPVSRREKIWLAKVSQNPELKSYSLSSKQDYSYHENIGIYAGKEAKQEVTTNTFGSRVEKTSRHGGGLVCFGVWIFLVWRDYGASSSDRLGNSSHWTLLKCGPDYQANCQACNRCRWSYLTVRVLFQSCYSTFFSLF